MSSARTLSTVLKVTMKKESGVTAKIAVIVGFAVAPFRLAVTRMVNLWLQGDVTDGILIGREVLATLPFVGPF